MGSKKVEKGKVMFFTVHNGEGANRWIYQDEYGYFVKHNGRKESVEKLSDGKWYQGTTIDKIWVSRHRNN